MNFLIDPFSGSAESRRRGVIHRLLRNKFDGKSIDEATVKRVFQKNFDHVRSLVVPRERLLEYRIEEGWEPFCLFLGEGAPDDEEFPSGSSSEDVQNAVRLIWRFKRFVISGGEFSNVVCWWCVGFAGFAETSCSPGSRECLKTLVL